MTEISRWGRSDLQWLLASLIGRAPEMPPGSRRRPAATSASTRQSQGQSERRPVGVRFDQRTGSSQRRDQPPARPLPQPRIAGNQPAPLQSV